MERKQKMKQKKNHNKTCRALKTSVVLLMIMVMLTGIMPDKKIWADTDITETTQVAGTNEVTEPPNTTEITAATEASKEPEKTEDKEKSISEDHSADNLPDIEIYIDVPDGFYSEKVSVSFRLRTKDGSMPDIKSVKARAGKKGSYTDVTESMTLEITEDCTVHVIAEQDCQML